MYTPENHQQMFEIITALRTYAGTNAMPGTAELLDDALFQPSAPLSKHARRIVPYLALVFLSMFLLYTFPQLAFWLPGIIYGR